MNTIQANAMRGRFHAVFGKMCAQFDHKNTSEYRHEISRWILGYDKSSTKWTGKEYSIVIDTIQDWMRGDVEPHPLTQNQRNLKAHDESQKQLIFSIENLGAPDAYIQAISNDKFGKRPWKDHGVYQLKQLRSTIKTRVQRAKSPGLKINK